MTLLGGGKTYFLDLLSLKSSSNFFSPQEIDNIFKEVGKEIFGIENWDQILPFKDDYLNSTFLPITFNDKYSKLASINTEEWTLEFCIRLLYSYYHNDITNFRHIAENSYRSLLSSYIHTYENLDIVKMCIDAISVDKERKSQKGNIYIFVDDVNQFLNEKVRIDLLHKIGYILDNYYYVDFLLTGTESTYFRLVTSPTDRKLAEILLTPPSIEPEKLFSQEKLSYVDFKTAVILSSSHWRTLRALCEIDHKLSLGRIIDKLTHLYHTGQNVLKENDEELVLAALSCKKYPLSHKFRHGEDFSTFEQLIAEGYFINPNTKENQSPRLSLLNLKIWADSKSEGRTNLHYLLTQTFTIDRLNFSSFEEFHGAWEVLRREILLQKGEFPLTLKELYCGKGLYHESFVNPTISRTHSLNLNTRLNEFTGLEVLSPNEHYVFAGRNQGFDNLTKEMTISGEKITVLIDEKFTTKEKSKRDYQLDKRDVSKPYLQTINHFAKYSVKFHNVYFGVVGLELNIK